MGSVLRAGVRAALVGILMVAGMAGAQAAGALAAGSCAAYGVAYDFNGQTEARVAAMRKCDGTCKVVATIKRGCTAYAIDGRNSCGAHGYGAAPTLGRAQNVALRYCYQHGGRDCVVRAWACDGKG
jgi:Domain of unknown function (DUF4189)